MDDSNFADSAVAAADVSVSSPRAEAASPVAAAAVATTAADDTVAQAEELKNQGNAFLKEEEFEQAVTSYSDAIALCPTVATYFSNRAAAHLKLKQYDSALVDAEQAVQLKPEWWKAHSRKISALHSLHRYADVLQACDETEGTVDEPTKIAGFLRKTRRLARRMLFTEQLRGKWHGTMADPMFGETVQAFEWLDAKRVKVNIIGQNLECTYKIRTDLESIDGGWRMDITVPKQPDVPYIFRLEADGSLLMVAPQMDPNSGFGVPQDFSGKTPGLVSLTRGEAPVETEVHSMSRDDKIIDTIEQLSSSFTISLPNQGALSEKEQLLQGLQVMQIMSVKVQNKYGLEIFQAAEKITQDPALAGTNMRLREVAAGLKAKIDKVQEAMGTTTPGANPAVHNAAAGEGAAATAPTTAAAATEEAEVVKAVDVEGEVLAASPDDRLAEFEHFANVESELKAGAEATRQQQQQQGSGSSSNSSTGGAAGGDTADAPAAPMTHTAHDTAATDAGDGQKAAEEAGKLQGKEETVDTAAASDVEKPAADAAADVVAGGTRRRSRLPWLMVLGAAGVAAGVAIGISRRNRR